MEKQLIRAKTEMCKCNKQISHVSHAALRTIVDLILFSLLV